MINVQTLVAQVANFNFLTTPIHRCGAPNAHHLLKSVCACREGMVVYTILKISPCTFPSSTRSGSQALQNADMRAKIEKLVAAGVVQTS